MNEEWSIKLRERRSWRAPLGLALCCGLTMYGCLAQVDGMEEEAGEVVDELAISGVHFQANLGKQYLGAQNNGGGAVNATATQARTACKALRRCALDLSLVPLSSMRSAGMVQQCMC